MMKESRAYTSVVILVFQDRPNGKKKKKKNVVGFKVLLIHSIER